MVLGSTVVVSLLGFCLWALPRGPCIRVRLWQKGSTEVAGSLFNSLVFFRWCFDVACSICWILVFRAVSVLA